MTTTKTDYRVHGVRGGRERHRERANHRRRIGSALCCGRFGYGQRGDVVPRLIELP